METYSTDGDRAFPHDTQGKCTECPARAQGWVEAEGITPEHRCLQCPSHCLMAAHFAMLCG